MAVPLRSCQCARWSLEIRYILVLQTAHALRNLIVEYQASAWGRHRLGIAAALKPTLLIAAFLFAFFSRVSLSVLKIVGILAFIIGIYVTIDLLVGAIGLVGLGQIVH